MKEGGAVHLPITEVSRRSIYRDRWIGVRVDEVDRNGHLENFGVVERADSVTVIPISEGGRTVLLRQYRYPTGDFSWEVPMGAIDEFETPRDAASRELLEETALRALDLRELGSYHVVPALSPQCAHVFLADVRDEDLAATTAVELVDDICDISVLRVEDVYKMAFDGEIRDGLTLTALLYVRLHLRQGQ